MDFNFNNNPAPVQMNDAAIASGGAFLVSELEKRDTKIREPLTSFTYPRDIPITVGGGWVENVSALNVSYAVAGSSVSGPVMAPSANGIPLVQANVGKDLFKTHQFGVGMRITFMDMQRSSFIGRSLDQMLTQGVRMTYDKHMDANAYVGLKDFGTTGIINNAEAVASNVAAVSGKTAWKDKTPQQVLDDVNAALTDAWAAAEYDPSAMPNHILIPYEQYNYILTTKVTELATETILDFLQKNNVANKNGKNLTIAPTLWCKGAGVGSTDRMAVYVNEDRFLKMEELVPLSRVMTQPNAANLCYDTGYAANLSEVEVFYPQCLRYYDGV